MFKIDIRNENYNSYPVLKTSGCILYSLEKTNGTIPWGSAACAKEEEEEERSRNKHVKQNCQFLDVDLLLIQITTNLHNCHSEQFAPKS